MFFRKKKQIKELLSSTKKLRWRRPALNVNLEDEERKVYRLDLFFDLVFVIAIGQLAHLFHAEITWMLVVQFIVLCIPVWWIWINSIYYVERFEDVTVRHRVYMFAMMIPVLGIWYSIHGAFGELAPWYVWSYVLARVLLWRVRHTANISQTGSGSLKKLATRIGWMNGIVALLWIGSLFVPEPWRYVVWFWTMVGELVYAYSLRDLNKDAPQLHAGHLTERFGLFTIIVLAEILIAVFSWLSELSDVSLTIAITAIATFLIACMLRWIYFDQIMYRPLKSTQPQLIFLWTYGHLPLVLWITALSWSLTHVMHMVGDHIDPPVVMVIVGSLSIVLLTLGYLGKFHAGQDLDGTIDFGDDDHFNEHLWRSKLFVAVLFLAWGVATVMFDISIIIFIGWVVLLLAWLALEWMIHRLVASTDGLDHETWFHPEEEECWCGKT